MASPRVRTASEGVLAEPLGNNRTRHQSRLRRRLPKRTVKPKVALFILYVFGSGCTCVVRFRRCLDNGGGGRQTPTPTNSVQKLALEGEIAALLAKQAVVEAPEGTGPLFRSSFFLTPKRDGTWRPILNLKPLNQNFVRPKRFRMENLHLIISLLRKGIWAATVDLKDAYLHIPMNREHRRFVAFQYADRDYLFRALPFGLSTAPRAFTRVAGATVSFLRRREVVLYVYLDDWLIVGNSRSETADVFKMVSTLQMLWWIVNEEKSRLTPTQNIRFLGATIVSQPGLPNRRIPSFLPVPGSEP
ncbi:putative TBC1 domain family member 2A [Apostichopus japonicus]|uniref:Putative TBC1 domain family member 2A n=1 Tax=Stichopus japonicus TaxID=307972 RepID=A0A2G8KRW3_STIJA|nr:putative TBC1 domain family member 2A [Apostichopus japonicus]